MGPPVISFANNDELFVNATVDPKSDGSPVEPRTISPPLLIGRIRVGHPVNARNCPTKPGGQIRGNGAVSSGTTAAQSLARSGRFVAS
jgi:hypothetical protein